MKGTIEGSKGTKEQWENKKNEKNNGKIKGMKEQWENKKNEKNNRKIKGMKEQWEDQRNERNNNGRNKSNKEIMGGQNRTKRTMG